jgi:hypothetical protein
MRKEWQNVRWTDGIGLVYEAEELPWSKPWMPGALLKHVLRLTDSSETLRGTVKQADHFGRLFAVTRESV